MDTEIESSGIILDYNEKENYYYYTDSSIKILGDNFAIHFSPKEPEPVNRNDDEFNFPLIVFIGIAIGLLIVGIAIVKLKSKKEKKQTIETQKKTLHSTSDKQQQTAVPNLVDSQMSHPSTQLPQQAPRQQPQQTTPTAPVEIPVQADDTWTCSKCEKKWPMEELFCGKCGTKRQEYWKCQAVEMM